MTREISFQLTSARSSSIKARLNSEGFQAHEVAFARVAQIYTILWLFEGALRKWVPGADTPMYVARDLIVLIGLTYCASKNRSKFSNGLAVFVFSLVLFGFTTFVLLQAFVLTQDNVPLMLVGLRSYIAPVLLALGAAAFGSRLAKTKVVRVILATGPFSALLCIAQVLSDPSSPVNREVVSDSASFVQFGVVRASGFFSAPSGLTGYALLGLALSLLQLSSKSPLERPWQTRLAVLSFASVIIVSGARLAILGASIVVIFVLLYNLFSQAQIRNYRLLTSLILIVGAIFALVFALPQVIESFRLRFLDAAATENSGERLWDQSFGYLTFPHNDLGIGAGVNSRAGIALGSGANWVEWDTERWVSELGLFGFLLAILRTCVGFIVSLVGLFGWRRLHLTQVASASVLGPLLIAGEITQFPSNQALCGILILLFLWQSNSNSEE